MAGDSNSTSTLTFNTNGNAAPKESPSSDSNHRLSSPPPKSSPPVSYSDSKSQSASPPHLPPPSSPPPPPPPPPPESKSNDDASYSKNSANSSPPTDSSPSPPDFSSSSPPPESSSSNSPPPTSPSPPRPSPSPSPPPPPPPSSPSPKQSPPTSTDSGDSGGDSSSDSTSESSPSPPPPTTEQSAPASPENGGTPSAPATPNAPPTAPATPLFSPPVSPYSTQSPPSLSLPSIAKQASGGGRPSSSSSSSFSPAGIIAGVAAGGLLLLFAAIAFLCFRKKRKIVVVSPPPGYRWDAANTSQGHGVNVHHYPGSGGPLPMGGGSEDFSGHHTGSHISTNPNSNMGVPPSGYGGLGLSGQSTFTYEELAAATNGFNQSNMLGQGGFGFVHKGVLADGRAVAVKSLKSGSGQGEREFKAEVEIISRVHHRHLVSLVGYCIAHGQRMLVYEFLPNNTLEYHLHKRTDAVLDFSTRLRIALGSAKGLSYLHEDCHPRIIHRDIKASNILLDENYEALVADFGLAKLTTDTNTHVSTRVMGTFGYLAPEYASSGKLTEKSDVFSFGVMLLELITGRRPVDPNMKYMEDSLVDWSRPLLTKALDSGTFDELADPRLEGNYNPREMQRMVACAAASIRHSARKRPKMGQIVRVLEGDVSLEDLNEGMNPGHSTAYPTSDGTSEYNSRAYSADLKRFTQMAFSTQEFASSEYGGSTSEYGLNPSSGSYSQDCETGR